MLKVLLSLRCIVLVSLLFQASNCDLFTCSETYCQLSLAGDGFCDDVCMNPSCHFDNLLTDSSFPDPSTYFSLFLSSDCFYECLNYCDVSLLANGQCNSECNRFECGWDLGDCGYCNTACTEAMLMNEVCDSQCQDYLCLYDNKVCETCAPGCTMAMVFDDNCQSDCNNYNCYWDSYKCHSTFCSYWCTPVIAADTTKCNGYCNNSNCNYNNDQCSCSPGCNKGVLAESTCRVDASGIIDDPCATLECDFKNNLCGYCASGCYEIMLGDGDCQAVCNNEDCSYDLGDCSCSPGCGSKFDPDAEVFSFTDGCNVDCLVAACLYNYGACTDSFLLRAAILNQFQLGNSTAILDLDLCTGVCTEADLQTLENNAQVCATGSSCDVPACVNCVGLVENPIADCLRQNDTACIIPIGVVVMGTLFPELSDCPIGYTRVDELGILFGSSVILCITDPEAYSQNYFKVFYVDAAAVPPTGTYGDGTIDNPMQSMYYALASVYADFTEIILRNNADHIFNIDDVPTPFISDKNDPLLSTRQAYIKELHLMGEDPTHYATVYWMGAMKITPMADVFYMTNLVFLGTKILRECTLDHCLYCPNIEVFPTFYLDDRKNIISQTLYDDEYGNTCNQYSEAVLFTFDSQTWIDNVKFSGFRHQFYAFIMTSKALNLTNVEFSLMQSASSGFVIDSSCLENCYTVDIQFINGSVHDLGAGYEDTSSVNTGGFFYGYRFHNLEISNVTFQYNFVFSALSSSSIEYMISIENHIGQVVITNCLFEYNYVNTMININEALLNYVSDNATNNDVSINLSQLHFMLSFTNFTHNYCSDDLINYLMNNVIQNVLITNVVIDDAIAGVGRIISLNNLRNLLPSESVGGDVYGIVDGVRQRLTAPPRYINLTNININEAIAGLQILNMAGMPNVFTTDVSISNIRDGFSSDLYRTIEAFSSSGRYLSQNVTSEETPNLQCLQVTLFSITYALVIDGLEMHSTRCTVKSGMAGIGIIAITSATTIQNVFIHDVNDSSETGLVLYITEAPSVVISDLTLVNITNNNYAAIFIQMCGTVSIFNLSGAQLTSTNSATIYLDEINDLLLEDYTVSDSSSEGFAGCISIKTAPGSSNIVLTRGTLTNCCAPFGQGGGISFDGYSSIYYSVITINTLKISNSTAADGAMIYISRYISLSGTFPSLFTGVTGANNTATKGGIIADNHQNGLLHLDSMILHNNWAIFGAIFAFYSSTSYTLKITNSQVIFGTSIEAIFYLFSLYPTCIIEIYNLYVSHRPALVFELSYVILVADHLRVSDVSSVISSTSSYIHISHGDFRNVSEQAIVLVDSTVFECYNCVFKYNNGDIIYAASFSNFTLAYSEISQNNITGTAMIYAFGLSQLGLGNYINSCVFIDNTIQEGDFIALLSTHISIVNSTFERNECLNSAYGGIVSTRSFVFISSCFFSLHSANTIGGFIYGLKGSYITVFDCIFTNGNAGISGGAIAADQSILTVEKSSFLNSRSLLYGGAIYFFDTSTIIKQCLFSNTISWMGSAIYGYKGDLKIDSSEFQYAVTTNSNDGSVYLELLSSALISNTLFHLSNAIIGGVLFVNTLSAEIDNSKFLNMTNIAIGAATFIGTEVYGKVVLTDNTFSYNNSTGSGAAIHVKNIDFTMNGGVVSYNTANDSGGGLYLSAPQCASCAFSIKGLAYIFNNSCGQDGGGLKWSDYKPNIDHPELIYNNSAPYGGNFASRAARLSFNNDRRHLSSIRIGVISDIPPGQAYKGMVTICLHDSYGNIVTTDNQSELILSAATGSSYSVSGFTNFIAQSGCFYITGFVPRGTPGTDMELELSTTGISTVKAANDDTQYSDTASILINLRNCTFGEKVGTTSCTICTAPYYLIIPEEDCKNCPDGATCEGDDIIYPNPGYWRSDLLSEIIYPCIVPSACSGGNFTHRLGNCSTGYSGQICQSCLLGFSRDVSGNCNKCPTPGLNVLILIVIIILIVIVSAVIVDSTLKTAFKPKELHSVYIKIFTNYIQLVYLVSEFKLSWPSTVTNLFAVQQDTAEVSNQLFSLECYLTADGTSEPSNSYYSKLVLMAVVPFVIFLISFLYWLGIAFTRDDNSYLKREMYATTIVLYFLIYPNIAIAMFRNFACQTIDKIGVYLTDNTAIECWGSEHLKYSLIVAIPGILLWAIGLPSIMLAILTKRRRVLHRDIYRVIFGFMYNGYKLSRYYWEFVLIYRKIFIIAILVFMSESSSQLQALTVIIVLFFSLYLQYSQKPYNHSTLNHMETNALFVANLTIYCGLYYLTGIANEAFKLFLFVLIVLGNAYFIFNWIYYMIDAIINIFVSYYPYYKPLFKKGDSYSEEFFVDELKKKGAFIDAAEGEIAYTFLNHEGKTEKGKLKSKNLPQLYHDTFMEEVLGMEEKDDRFDNRI